MNVLKMHTILNFPLEKRKKKEKTYIALSILVSDLTN